MADENIDYEALKKRGFLRQRQEGFFILRTRMPNGVYKKGALEKLARISRRFGKGFMHATVRQGLEIPFIRLEDISEIEKELESSGIERGASGARLRATTSCPGNNWCRFGLIDTFSLSEKIEKELGLRCGMELPHKFKIAVSGCPNMCARSESSDIGIHGQADSSTGQTGAGYAVYLGGRGGRQSRAGFKLKKVFTEEEVLALIKKVVIFYKDHAKPRQRLGLLIEEIGKENFMKDIIPAV